MTSDMSLTETHLGECWWLGSLGKKVKFWTRKSQRRLRREKSPDKRRVRRCKHNRPILSLPHARRPLTPTYTPQTSQACRHTLYTKARVAAPASSSSLELPLAGLTSLLVEVTIIIEGAHCSVPTPLAYISLPLKSLGVKSAHSPRYYLLIPNTLARFPRVSLCPARCFSNLSCCGQAHVPSKPGSQIHGGHGASESLPSHGSNPHWLDLTETLEVYYSWDPHRVFFRQFSYPVYLVFMLSLFY